MGHRVTNHESLCKNPHGHRYKMEVEVSGPLNTSDQHSQQGMVIDFGHLKQLIQSSIIDELDHSFMYWEEDKVMSDFAQTNPTLKLVRVAFVPTAECIAGYIAQKLSEVFKLKFPDIQLTQLSVYETPNCRAIWTPDA
jgi:6-pyruvoyltetrahydropterin/6-carboxytetrahydropterin synthase